MTRPPTFLNPEQHQELISGMNKIEKDSLQTIKFSERILMDDFFKTNQHIFIAMWNSLQTAIENTLTELLKKEDVRNDIINSDITDKLKNMLKDEIDEDNYRWFLSKWQTKGNNKTEYTESKLQYFDLDGNISEDLKTGLIEMNTLRNCLVHRAGIADKKTVKQAPSLNLTVNKEIQITQDMLLKYHKIAGNYGTELMGRAIKCKYLNSP